MVSCESIAKGRYAAGNGNIWAEAQSTFFFQPIPQESSLGFSPILGAYLTLLPHTLGCNVRCPRINLTPDLEQLVEVPLISIRFWNLKQGFEGKDRIGLEASIVSSGAFNLSSVAAASAASGSRAAHERSKLDNASLC